MVTVRHAGRLVAAAALVRHRRFGLPVLTPVGAGISDITDVLIDDSCAAEAGRHLARGMARQPAHTIDLSEVPDQAAVWHVAHAWPFRARTIRGSICLDLPARPLDELIETLPRHTAQTRRRKSRKIASAGIETCVTPAARAADTVDVLLRLHREQWRGRAMNPEHCEARFAAHLVGAVPAMVDRGQAVLVEHRIKEKPVAVDLLITGHRTVGAYLYGFRPELRGRIDVAQLLLGADLELTRLLGRPRLSLLRGDEPHKRRWRPDEVANQRLLLACRGRVPTALYAMGVRGRQALVSIVKSRPLLNRTARSIRAARSALRRSGPAHLAGGRQPPLAPNASR